MIRYLMFACILTPVLVHAQVGAERDPDRILDADAPRPIPALDLPPEIRAQSTKPSCVKVGDTVVCPAIGAEPVTFTKRGSAPFQAQIYSLFDGYSPEERAAAKPWQLAHRCGGSLIAPDWVLTAAHCFPRNKIGKEAEWLRGNRIRLGAVDLSKGDGKTFAMREIILHPDYEPKTQANDIALIRLAKSAPLNARIATIAMNGARPDDEPVGYESYALSTGFGRTTPDPKGKSSTYLMMVSIDTWQPERCDAATGYPPDIAPRVVCAASPGRDTCQGDSGGPLFYFKGNERRQIGIVSWGKGCAQTGNPGVYTKVEYYVPWINGVVATRR